MDGAFDPWTELWQLRQPRAMKRELTEPFGVPLGRVQPWPEP
jgi:hypothetical protein